MLEAEDFESMCKILLPGENAPVSQEDGIESYLRRFCYRLERRLLRFTTQAPVAMYTFIALRRIEVNNIITVIEGVRYHVPQEEILKLLIL